MFTICSTLSRTPRHHISGHRSQRDKPSARLYADQQRNEDNFKIVDRFLSDLVDDHRAAVRSPNGNAVLWRDVPADMIRQLLLEFLVHPQNHDFQGDAIAEFLADAVARGDPQLSTWTVAVPVEGNKGPVSPGLRSGLAVNAKKRLVLLRQTPPRSLLVSGKKARVGSRADVQHGLSAQQVQAVTEVERIAKPDLKDVPEDAFRAVMPTPLLVIYLLRGVERDRKGAPETDYRNGLILPALGLHFPGIKDPNAPKRYVSYRLNRVAQGELESDGDDLGDDGDADADD